MTEFRRVLSDLKTLLKDVAASKATRNAAMAGAYLEHGHILYYHISSWFFIKGLIVA